VARIGYNSNGFAHHRLEEVLPWLSELGYQAVAITPDVAHLDPSRSELDDVRKIARLCRRYDLTPVIETGARYLLDPRRKHRPNLLDDSPAAEVRAQLLDRMLVWCEVLEAPVLSLWSGALPASVAASEAAQRLVDRLGELAIQARQRGVSLGLEPEPGHLIATVADWQSLRQELGPDLKLTLDVGHLLVEGEGPLLEVAAPVLDDLVNLQLDDMMEGVHDHLAPGAGQVDWHAVRELLRQLPEDTPACYELSRDSHRFHELAPQLATFLND